MTSETTSTASTRVGGWLFRHRSWLPLPIAALLLLAPASTGSRWFPVVGLTLVAVGESIRLWAVRHIGVISRTRSDRLGPLVANGPFRYLRNPLYLGNILLWLGFALSARLPWLVPICVVVLASQYHAIVCWEEALLASRLGQPYLDYVARVPRWLPRWPTHAAEGRAVAVHSWGHTLFSERATLVAIMLGYVLLTLKHAWSGH